MRTQRFEWTCAVLAILALLGSGGCGSKPKDGEAAKAGEGAKEEGHEEGGHEEGVIELTPEQAKNAGIQTAVVSKQSTAGLVEASAQIEAAGDRQARVGAQVAGRITALKASVGSAVRRGSVLMVVDSPDLGRAKADFLSGLAVERVTQATAEREKALFEKKITSERDWRQAEAEAVKARAERDAAENRLHALGVSDDELGRIKTESHYTSTMPIVSPLDGVVVERSATLGQMVQPTDTLAVVMDLREVWILVDIYDRDLPQVKVGQTATARLAAYPGQEFTGRIQSIGAVVEEKTRSVKVRIALPNSDGTLKPGMFATVTLQGTTGETRDRLLVPAAAVQREGEGHVVFVKKGEHGFEARKVEVKRELGEWVELTSGVTEGDTIVTTGSFFLKAEMQKAELGGGHDH